MRSLEPSSTSRTRSTWGPPDRCLRLILLEFADEFLQDLGHDLGRQRAVPHGVLVDALENPIGIRSLHEIAVGSGADHREDRRPVRIAGKSDDLRPGRDAPDPRCRLQPSAGHVHVEQGHGRLMEACKLHGPPGIGGLPDQHQ